jgi:hypothetical protein
MLAKQVEVSELGLKNMLVTLDITKIHYSMYCKHCNIIMSMAWKIKKTRYIKKVLGRFYIYKVAKCKQILNELYDGESTVK